MPSQINASWPPRPWAMKIEGYRAIAEETPDWGGAETVDNPEVLACRTRLVEFFRSTEWYQQAEDEHGTIRDLVDSDLDTAGDVNEMNDAIDSIYDLADVERVWLA
jgi:hypothetical protein